MFCQTKNIDTLKVISKSKFGEITFTKYCKNDKLEFVQSKNPIIKAFIQLSFIFFTGPLLFIVLLLKFIFTPFGRSRMMTKEKFSYLRTGMPKFSFADKIRGMNDEEFNSFKEKKHHRFNTKCSY